MVKLERWPNQDEALEFAMCHPACMLDMDMGTGKTRVAIDAIMERNNVRRVLVVCPKAVLGVWPSEFAKHTDSDVFVWSWDRKTDSVAAKTKKLQEDLAGNNSPKQVIVLNYDCVWRSPMGNYLRALNLDMIILDESHRAKAAGSKVSKYLFMLGKNTRYKMCLSGTPMANSPLDVYGQYRFLDASIFGSRYDYFQDEYAIMGGPERRFVVGFKNQQRLKDKFYSIAYSCKLDEIRDRIKLPESLPPVVRSVYLPSGDMALSRKLARDFVASCDSGNTIVLSNVLNKMLRLQQIASGYCMTQEDPLAPRLLEVLNTAKEDALYDILQDTPPNAPLVVFCVFRYDLEACGRACDKAGRKHYELSGSINQLDEWNATDGGVMVVQIQAGSEGVDMTKAHRAIYYSLPHSLALYEQSNARLHRPGQTAPTAFIHLLARGTVDEIMYNSLMNKRDLITDIKAGVVDFGYIK